MQLIAPVVFPANGHYADSVPAEFGELEWDRYDDFNILSRSLTEISADLTEVLTQLGRFVRQVDSDMDEFSNLAHRLQDEITQARMVPIGNLYTRLSRTARDAAKATGKQVELVLEGAATELDNGVIQQISDPLIHLVRNSVAHGIETPLEREECGKPASGRVTLRAYHRGNQIYIEVEDEGRGIDYEKIRATALSLGLVPADVAARLTESELLEFLFRPGFSTASRKTELAGRGVGLDVVRANLTGLNGEIAIETERTVGTRFTLKVPLTLIITQALFLRFGSWVFGIPLASVEEIRRLRASEIEEVGGKQLTLVRGQVMEVVRLDSRLGLDPVEPANGFYRMVIVNVGDRGCAGDSQRPWSRPGRDRLPGHSLRARAVQCTAGTGSPPGRVAPRTRGRACGPRGADDRNRRAAPAAPGISGRRARVVLRTGSGRWNRRSFAESGDAGARGAPPGG